MSTLRVHLCPLEEVDDDTALDFEILDGARRVLERGSAAPRALPRVARTELVVAAPDALLLDATLPRLSGSRLRAALPALAEPMLLAGMEQAFVVASRVDGTGLCTLAVVYRKLMCRALDLLARRRGARAPPARHPAGERPSRAADASRGCRQVAPARQCALRLPAHGR